MKLGIIGVGAVGAATAMAVALRARARELVLVDRDLPRAKAVATDMHYGVPLSPLIDVRDGDYDDLAVPNTAFSETKSATLKWPIATPFFSAWSKISRNAHVTFLHLISCC